MKRRIVVLAAILAGGLVPPGQAGTQATPLATATIGDAVLSLPAP
jgi:hypothetical protein